MKSHAENEVLGGVFSGAVDRFQMLEKESGAALTGSNRSQWLLSRDRSSVSSAGGDSEALALKHDWRSEALI